MYPTYPKNFTLEMSNMLQACKRFHMSLEMKDIFKMGTSKVPSKF
jgi:hypothetical protein